MKVLIVDDEPFALLRLERLLREASVEEVLTAQNAYEAKKILEENPDIEAVFLDICMPGKDGVQLAQEIVGEGRCVHRLSNSIR
jgi:YesN/AraC family two-component response regulator